MVNVNNILYFSATDGVSQLELWKSDGTAAGTVMVKDIAPASNTGSYPAFLTNHNGVLYFAAGSVLFNKELWRSDGTEAGTVLVRDINPVTGSEPSYLTSMGGQLYFAANDGTNGVADFGQFRNRIGKPALLF